MWVSYIYNNTITKRVTGSDVSTIDISNYNIDILLRFSNNQETPPAYVDISNNQNSTIKTLYLNNETVILNNRLQLPADEPVEISDNIAVQSVSQGDQITRDIIGDITVNTAESSGDTALLSHLLKNYNNQANFVNPYLANNFEQAMNSNLNPFVNNPSQYNPMAYANYFNPSNSDMLMRSNIQNQNVNKDKDTKNSENSEDFKTSGQLLELPKSNMQIIKDRDKINSRGSQDLNENQSVECTCPDKKNYKDESMCPPCPACDRCPEQDFMCKKVYKNKLNNSSHPITQELIEPNNKDMPAPVPVLTDFSTFGM